MGVSEPRSGLVLPGLHLAQSDSPAIPIPRTGAGERTAAQTGIITTTVGKVIAWGWPLAPKTALTVTLLPARSSLVRASPPSQ